MEWCKKLGKKIINTGKKIVKGIVDTGKKAWNFVSEKLIQPVFNTVKKIYNNVKKSVSNFANAVSNYIKPKPAVDDSLSNIKKKQAIDTKKDFINYANQYGLEAARNKIKDPKKLEEFIQAYCDKFGLDKISIENALKTVNEVNSKVSLASKYTAICESIKRSPSGTSSVSTSSQSAANKHYLKAAASTLSYVRGLCINNTYNQTTVNSRINGISNYSKDTTGLTTEYKSCMQIHAGDMKGYIQSGKGLYKPVKEWVDTGRYSSGTYKTVYVHQESDAYRVYSSGLYKDTVAVASKIQGQAQKIEAISGIVGGLANVASQLEITTPTIDISNVTIVNGNGTLSTIPTLTLQGEFAVSVSGTLEGTAAGITAMGIYGGSSSGGDDAIKSGNKSIDDLINSMEETTNRKGVARNFESSGGYEQTLKDFETLNPTNVKDIQTKYGPRKVGTLNDGTKVVARQGSKTGGPTLEIKVSNSKVYKIRY